MLITNRRAARLFVGPGDSLEETDRIVDDVHSEYQKQRLVAVQVRSLASSRRSRTTSPTPRRSPSTSTRSAGLDRVLIGAPDDLLAEFKSKLHPYLRERIAGRISVDIENASVDDVCAAAKPLIEEHVRKCEREALDRLAQGVGTGGRGAAGIADVLDALNQARVETLLIAENFRASGRVDFEAGLLLPDGRRVGRGGRGHRRAGDREGDRAVGDRDGRAPPRRPRAARRNRSGAEILSTVAFLGTGLMGAPMARNLAGAGHEVRAWNRTAAKAEGLGATVAGSPAEAVDGADVVVTMLADGPAVEAAMEGVSLSADQIWWQASTVGLEWIAKLAEGTAARFVDGPVMGTKGPAEQGQLTVLAAGAGRERLADVFDPVAAKVVDLGDEVGAGTKLKLVLNNWVISFVESLAETIALAEGLGVDPAKFFEGIEGGAMYAPYVKLKGDADDRALLRAELLAQARAQGRGAGARRRPRARPGASAARRWCAIRWARPSRLDMVRTTCQLRSWPRVPRPHNRRLPERLHAGWSAARAPTATRSPAGSTRWPPPATTTWSSPPATGTPPTTRRSPSTAVRGRCTASRAARAPSCIRRSIAPSST